MCRLQNLTWFLLFDLAVSKYNINIDTSMSDNLYPVIRQSKFIFSFVCVGLEGFKGGYLVGL